MRSAPKHALRADHPRACGVYLKSGHLFMWRTGSSPRVRGLPPVPRETPGNRWIIPARAGFTGEGGYAAFPLWDHPRACGVYLATNVDAGLAEGSSPRVRGLPIRLTMISVPARIIPARAGFTVLADKNNADSRDHPRACGVYPQRESWRCCSGGSSPRVRGLPRKRQLHKLEPRIIPARAGFTAEGAEIAYDLPGSSPRVRGLRTCCAGRSWK